MTMPQAIYYSAPLVNIGTTAATKVDLSDFCKSAVLNRVADALESSSMASRDRFYQAGMNSNELTLVFNQTYEASEVYATLKALVGTQCYADVKPTSAATSATNPLLSITNGYLESLEVLAANLGELGEITVVLAGGTFAEATA